MSTNTAKENDRKSYEKIGRIYNALENRIDKVFVERLLETEGDINYGISELSGKVPNLLHAALYKDKSLFNLLLEHGADFTVKNEDGRTVVHKVIDRNIANEMYPLNSWFEYVDFILAAHVKFNNPSNPSDERGITHFHAACMSNNAAAVEYFLLNGVEDDLAVKADSPHLASYTPLHLAVEYGSAEVFEILLKRGANVHLKNGFGFSALHLIVEKKLEKLGPRKIPAYDRILKIFVNFAIMDSNDFETADDFGISHWHVACIHNDVPLVEKLLGKIENVGQVVNFDSPLCPGFTALHFAAFSNLQIFQLLLRKGADIQAKNERGATPLDLFLRCTTTQRIVSLLSTTEQWKSIVLSDNATKLLDVTVAMDNADEFASFLNCHETALTAFVPLDSPLCPGYTLLHLAVMLAPKVSLPVPWCLEKQHDSRIVEECLRREATVVTTQDVNGSSALHLAFHACKYDLAGLLLNRHPDKPDNNPVDKSNLSHFHVACATGHLRQVERFLSNGANVNSPARSTTYTFVRNREFGYVLLPPGSTALHFSLAHADRRITEMLLAHGADVNAPDALGFTPVHRLLYSTREQVDDLLLSADNLKNDVAHGGLSHLHVACHFARLGAIEKLLEAGADANAPLTDRKFERRFYVWDYVGDLYGPGSDYEMSMCCFLSGYRGYSPLDFLLGGRRRSAGNTYDDLVKTSLLLMERNADVIGNRDRTRSALRKLLRTADCDLECYGTFSANATMRAHLEDEFGITSLHSACHLADYESVESLVRGGANVHSRVSSTSPCWQGYTPLHCAGKRAYKLRDERYGVVDQRLVDALGKIVRLLISHGADPLATGDNGDNALNTYDFAAVLLEDIERYDLEPAGRKASMLLSTACLAKDERAVEQLLKLGVGVDWSCGYFSDGCPGMTLVHVVIGVLADDDRPKGPPGDEAFLRILDRLLERGADVNAADAMGNTPSHLAVCSTALRRALIRKLMSYGADVHATNVEGRTPFEQLLRHEDASWEDFEVFLKAGYDFDMYNPITQESYVATLFHSHYGDLTNRTFLKIMDSPETTKVNSRGRTALHNVVSIGSWDYRACDRVSEREIDQGMLVGVRINSTAHEAFEEFIEGLLMRGCDIDRQDNEGKTALHLAVSFDNHAGISGLLNNGADVNVADNDGKTIFALCSPRTDPHTKNLLAVHVYKLVFCGQYVSEQKESVNIEEQYSKRHRYYDAICRFREEVERAESIKIGTTSLSLREFLMGTDTDAIYGNMTAEEREEVDKFFQSKHDFQEIGGLLKLKYRKIIEKAGLKEPAAASLNEGVVGYFNRVPIVGSMLSRYYSLLKD